MYGSTCIQDRLLLLHLLRVLTLRKEVAEMEMILPFISDIGFPAAITFYLLYRIEGKLDTLNESIRQIRTEPPRIPRLRETGVT